MCGIAGILQLGNLAIEKNKIIAMNNALAHRGPDDEGYFQDDFISLAHKRLSIIDLSSLGHQPMKSNDSKFIIVFNGEIYNFKQVKEKIKDYHFQTGSDTEVILAAYQLWGKDCLQYFNGMFAFAVWDKEKKELFIARDRMGKKPMYYFKNENFFLFSSEIRSLLASDLIPKKLNQNGLIDFLRYQTVHAPETILQNVNMLMPGCWMKISKNDFEIQSYWKIGEELIFSSKDKSYKQICEDVKRLLLSAVEKRLISDVPLGAFLSGGIDSSAIVGLMTKHSDSKVKTFNISFEEEEFSEAGYARIIAKKFNTDHHEIKLSPDDFLGRLPDALNALDHPSGDGANTFVISKKIKEAGITVALSGLGGDELFCGYAIFRRSLWLAQNQWIWKLPKSLKIVFADLLKNIKPSVSTEKIYQLLSLDRSVFQQTYPIARQVFLENQIQKLTKNFNLPENSVSKIISNIRQPTANSQLTQVSIAEISTYMQNILLRDTDQMSMASALEVRTPFLDYELTAYVLGIEDKFKYPHFSKKLLVDSLGDLLPNEIVHRKKMGFVFPWEYWMKNELKEFCEKNIHELSERENFNSQYLKSLWICFLKGDKRVNWAKLWILVVLNHWLTKNQIK